MIDKRLLSPKEAATYLGIHVDTLAHWRMKGVGPKFIRYSPRSLRYRLADLDTWIQQREYEHTTQYH